MALTAEWIETLRTGINQRCSILALNPLSIGMTPAHSLVENAHTGILLKTAIPQGVESAIMTLAPYFINHTLWSGAEPDMAVDYEPYRAWRMWTARTLRNAAYAGFFIPHEQTNVTSSIQLDQNWYDTMRSALNLLVYVSYTSVRQGLGQSGDDGIEESYSRWPKLLPAERLPRTPVAVWGGTLGSQTPNSTMSASVWGAKYSNAGSDATGYGHAYGYEFGEDPKYSSSWWNFHWAAGKNVVEYNESSVVAKPISSTIRRYHKIVKDSSVPSVGALRQEIPAQLNDIAIDEGWKYATDQVMAAETAATFQEEIETELNDLSPQEPSEVYAVPNTIDWVYFSMIITQYNCNYYGYEKPASIRYYPSANLTMFASYRKYNFEVLV